jgi:hypothetical protein
MLQFLFDTDHLTLYQYKHPPLMQRFAQQPADSVAICPINISDSQHEVFDKPSKALCRDGNLRVLREAAYRPCERLVTMSEAKEGWFTSITITCVVTNGFVIPSSPLPEGAEVEILLHPVRQAVTPELQEEFDCWERAGTGTIEMVETLAEEMETDAKR